MMAHAAGYIAKVRLVRISPRELLGSALGGELLQRTMACEAAAILDRRIQYRRLFAMASTAVDVGLGVKIVGEAGAHPRGKLLLDQGHVIIGRRAPGEVLALQSEALAGHIGMTLGAFHSQRRAGVSCVNASGESVLLGLA